MDLSTLMSQQRQIVKTLDRPLFVSAGAGSGKTFTLTRRIVYALSPESGPFVGHLDQVLAITFTKDAAEEIRDRVRRALIDEGMDEEALAVDDAWISTIHGMCTRILRAHALELGLDPEFTVIEDTDELMDQAVEHVLGRISNGEAAPGLKDALAELRKLFPLANERKPDGSESAGTSVKSLVRKMLELACQQPGGMDDVHLLRGRADTSALADAYRGALKASKGWTDCAERALAAIDAFEASGKTLEDAGRLITACTTPKGRAPKAFPKEQVELLKAEAADTFVNLVLACGGKAYAGLETLARAVAAEYDALKADASGLDNNDLLRKAYFALRDHPAIRADYEGRFKMVMIDEFQDTDQMQVDLIRYLTGPGERALCTVGDAQQSIYRFRGAEVEVFRRQERKVGGQVRDAAAPGDAPAGELVKLVRNFRSHDEVLRYVAQVFDGERDGIMDGFLDLEACEGRKDTLVAPASRRQAIFVAGGTTLERTQAKACAIAERFRALADAGQPQGGMVLLLGRMTNAGVYAQAFRDQGLNCVIAGGTVFAGAPEVKAVRALVCALANPADTKQGLMPLLASPAFALGAQEFLALATAIDPETGETRRRNIDAGIMSHEDAPGFGDLPLLDRAREVMGRALLRVGHDPFARIARDAVNESGWLVRLAARGPEGKAVAANVLKALDIVSECELKHGNAPRSISVAFDRALRGKEAPGALNEEESGAVRIMTVHASKGLEYPVVAVDECYGVSSGSAALKSSRTERGIDAVVLPTRFPSATFPDGVRVDGADVMKQLKKTGGKGSWLPEALVDEVCATGSPAEALMRFADDEVRLSLEERARLLYVAMTRARELVILAMDGSWSANSKVAAPKFDPSHDLTGKVLERILPPDGDNGPRLDADRLVFENSVAGDYELIALDDFKYGAHTVAANAQVDAAGRLVRLAEGEEPGAGGMPAATAPGPADDVPDHFELVRPAAVGVRIGSVPRDPRDSYSYSSVAAALHGEAEDRAMPDAPQRPDDDAAADAAGAGARDGDPTALGSAFHAACQWLIETGSETVPAERIGALARYWGVTDAQRVRLASALDRWCASAVRRELRACPNVQAEVPFFSLGCADEDLARHGAYAEGAIDALGFDARDRSHALVIDYKTGGSAGETPEALHEKHALQARVYADVLHRAGFGRVTLRFVRVEVEDPASPGEPQVVSYEM